MLHHIDVYRSDQIEETVELGLGELLDCGAVPLIEWGDAIRPALPPDYLEIALELGQEPDDRAVRVQIVGPGWAPRFAALCRALPAAAGGA